MDIIWREQAACFVDIFDFIINLKLHPMGTWVCWFTMPLMQSIELFSWKQTLNIVKSLKLMPPTIWDQEQIIKHGSSSNGFMTDVWSNGTWVSLSMLFNLRKWALVVPSFSDEAMAKPMSRIIHFDCVKCITRGNTRGKGRNSLITFVPKVNQSGVGIRNCTNYWFFSNSLTGWLFDYEHFQTPETGGSLVLNFFIYLESVVLWFWIFSNTWNWQVLQKSKYSAPHWCKPELNHTTDSIGNLIIIVGIGSHFVSRKLPKVPSNFTFQKSSKKI
jgi:hypothetical protein